MFWLRNKKNVFFLLRILNDSPVTSLILFSIEGVTYFMLTFLTYEMGQNLQIFLHILMVYGRYKPNLVEILYNCLESQVKQKYFEHPINFL